MSTEIKEADQVGIAMHVVTPVALLTPLFVFIDREGLPEAGCRLRWRQASRQARKEGSICSRVILLLL